MLASPGLALIRPDQVVAWRSGAPQVGTFGRVLARALGHTAEGEFGGEATPSGPRFAQPQS